MRPAVDKWCTGFLRVARYFAAERGTLSRAAAAEVYRDGGMERERASTPEMEPTSERESVSERG